MLEVGSSEWENKNQQSAIVNSVMPPLYLGHVHSQSTPMHKAIHREQYTKLTSGLGYALPT
jgi:hypothetical protein